MSYTELEKNDIQGVASPKTQDAAPEKPTFLEFFAGSGLVAAGLRSYFKPIWANDVCPKKAAVYTANHGNRHFQLGSISYVKGFDLPQAMLSWASFPCQDLSLAGLTAGIHAQRSGLVWQWLRIIDEMKVRPPLLVAENVTGLVSMNEGEYYRILHRALRERGYLVGAVVLDAARWVPQSRKRVFVIAVEEGTNIFADFVDSGPNWAHPAPLVNAVRGLKDFIWWKLPEPAKRKINLADIVEWDVPADEERTTQNRLNLIPETHRAKLDTGLISVAPGYKRTRHGRQVLELRFDGIAGCLRTAQGGSSRQFIVLKKGSKYDTRLLTVRETARLMGAPDSYKIPGSYNDGYTAMGDAVAVPVSQYLAKHLLSPLARTLMDG